MFTASINRAITEEASTSETSEHFHESTRCNVPGGCHSLDGDRQEHHGNKTWKLVFKEKVDLQNSVLDVTVINTVRTRPTNSGWPKRAEVDFTTKVEQTKKK
jgi:hypothetical protein